MKKHNALTVLISLFISILYYEFVVSKNFFISTHFLKVLDIKDYIFIFSAVITSIWIIFITSIFLISFFIDLLYNNKEAKHSLSMLSILLVVCFNFNVVVSGLWTKEDPTNFEMLIGGIKCCTDYIVIWFSLYLIRKYRDSIGDFME